MNSQKCNLVTFSPCEINSCKLSLMHMAHLKGVPSVWSFTNNDYDFNWNVVAEAFSWHDHEQDLIFLEWRIK